MLEWHYIYGANSFKFHDDASTANIGEWKKLCNMMLSNLASRSLIKADLWKYEITARADQMDNDLIDLLAKTGCKRAAFGIETGSEAILKSMNKRLDMSKAVDTLKKIKAKGIETVGLFVVGFPGETDVTINKTCDLIQDAKPDVVCAMPLMVFPGTKVYADCKKSGWIDDSYWLQDKPQPYYTAEQPMKKLSEWATKVTNAKK
jgi:p-methyltransferase